VPRITEKRREYNRRYRQENYDKVREAEKRSRLKNIEKHRAGTRERMRKLRAEQPEKYSYQARKSRHRCKYGLTPEQRDTMLQQQNGCCAICKSPDPRCPDWHTDHCHKTKQVRGLLCSKCNLMLGHAQDNPSTLRSAAEYLERNPER